VTHDVPRHNVKPIVARDEVVLLAQVLIKLLFLLGTKFG
jgi:hypothetical protein